MYLPAAFADPDPARCRDLIAAHPLATVVVNGRDGGPPDAQPVPLLCLPMADADSDGPDGIPPGRWRLLGHVARANALADARPDTPVLAVFSGPEHPISPSWYASKAADPRVVPTWNYAAVHVAGRLTVSDDPARILDALARLTDVMEGRLGSPWRLADAPADYLARLVRAVVTVEIDVAADGFQGKWKLSQNRSAADRASVAEALTARATPAGAAMARLVRAAGSGTSIPRRPAPADAP